MMPLVGSLGRIFCGSEWSFSKSTGKARKTAESFQLDYIMS